MVTTSPSDRPSSLPIPLTALIRREIADLLRRDDARLLRLTDPGGLGIACLALTSAQTQSSDVTDGVTFVSLAPLADAGLILLAIAQSVGVRESEAVRS
jgi:predicted ATPase